MSTEVCIAGRYNNIRSWSYGIETIVISTRPETWKPCVGAPHGRSTQTYSERAVFFPINTLIQIIWWLKVKQLRVLNSLILTDRLEALPSSFEYLSTEIYADRAARPSVMVKGECLDFINEEWYVIHTFIVRQVNMRRIYQINISKK